MKLSSLLLVSLLGVALGKDTKVPRYTVNLDLPPMERWNKVLEKHKNVVPILNTFFEKYIPRPLIPAVEWIGAHLDDYMPQPYADEIRGMAQYMNVSVGKFLIPNILYDVTAFNHDLLGQSGKMCTSIVAENKAGEIIHGRNLDYPVVKNLLHNITVILDFQRGGKTVFTSTSYVGHLGVFTAQKPGLFTLSLDERDQGNIVENAIMALLEKAKLVSYAARDVMESAMSYAEVVRQLSTEKIIAPVYYIIGGVKSGEGAVITRDRMEAKDVWMLNATKRWYLLETNYDHWLPTPDTDQRREDGIRAMDSVGQGNINNVTLFKVLSTPRVMNEITTYTTIMSAKYPDMYQAWNRGVQ